jgi:hypothetical protein
MNSHAGAVHELPRPPRYAAFPDVSLVASSWGGEKQDNYDIYVKLIGPGNLLRFTTDPNASFAGIGLPTDSGSCANSRMTALPAGDGHPAIGRRRAKGRPVL